MVSNTWLRHRSAVRVHPTALSGRKCPAEYVEARKFYDYDEHSRVGAKHGEFVTDEICDRFCVLGTAEQATAKLRELESIGVDQFGIYLRTERPGGGSWRPTAGRSSPSSAALQRK